MARRSKKSKGLKVDFTGVESSGNVEEGTHIAEVIEVETKVSENSGNDYLNWKLKAPGGTLYHTTSLQPQALWNLRNVLEGLGMEVPEGEIELDLDEFTGMELGVEVEHEVYQGKKRPRIIDVFSPDEAEGEEKEEEEEESGDDLTYEEVMGMSKEELLEVAEEEGIKVLAKVKKSIPKLREFLVEKLGLEEEESEEEEESGDDVTAEEVMEMSKEELLELAEEEEIKVLAKVKRNLKNLRTFMIEKLELDEEEEEEEKSPRRSRRKTGSNKLGEGDVVKFEDDGELIEGKILSINEKDKFAVVEVDGEDWEVELEDISK